MRSKHPNCFPVALKPDSIATLYFFGSISVGDVPLIGMVRVEDFYLPAGDGFGLSTDTQSSSVSACLAPAAGSP